MIEKVRVKLIGEDGNSFVIIDAVVKAMRNAGLDEDYIDEYRKEVMAGDYDHLVRITMKYVEVY